MIKWLTYLGERFMQENTKELLVQFKKNEFLSSNDLLKEQERRLISLIEYLIKFNTHYSNFILANNIDITKTKSIKSILDNFPIIDKEYIRSRELEWITTNSNAKLTSATTSGSTGVPFKIFHSNVSRDIKTANKYRLFKWHKIERWEKQLYLGCTYGPKISFLSKFKIFINDKFIHNRHVLDFTTINEENILIAINKINSLNPSSIWAYPSIISEVSQYIVKNNIVLNANLLKGIILSGEGVTEYTKNLVYKAFGVYPVDEYNSNEGFIAGSCENGNLHLMEDTLIAEILHEDGTISESGYGELLITFLYALDYPFIRYKIGDIVTITLERCKCGRTFKVITAVDGRKGSFVYNGDKKISNATCNHYITKSPFMSSIIKYQIVQNDLASVNVNLVLNDKTKDFTQFENTIIALFDNIKVHFNYVDEIPRLKSGKHIDVLNNVNIK